MLTYTVVLLAEADGRYSALVPALPGAVSWGDTVEDALANITEAIAALLEAMGADRDEIPVERPHSVVTTVTVPAPEPATAVRGALAVETAAEWPAATKPACAG